MKKFYIVLIALFTAILLVNPCTIKADNEDRVVDYANLLSDEEEKTLEAEFKEISDKYQIEIMVLTIADNEGKGYWDYACDFYDYNGYGYGTRADGLMLAVDMTERMVEPIGTGLGVTIFTDAIRDRMIDEMYSDLRNGNYYRAFHDYGALCEKYITEYNYRNNKGAKDYTSADFWTYAIKQNAGIALGSGAVVGIIVVVVLALKNRSVSYKDTAHSYSVPGTFNLRGYSDIYLYRDVHRRRIERDHDGGGGGGGHTTTSHSSSGRSHSSGGGRHF